MPGVYHRTTRLEGLTESSVQTLAMNRSPRLVPGAYRRTARLEGFTEISVLTLAMNRSPLETLPAEIREEIYSHVSEQDIEYLKLHRHCRDLASYLDLEHAGVQLVVEGVDIPCVTNQAAYGNSIVVETVVNFEILSGGSSSRSLLARRSKPSGLIKWIPSMQLA